MSNSQRRPTRILITNIALFNGNRGVGALAISTIYFINELYKKSGRKVEICVADGCLAPTDFVIHNEKIRCSHSIAIDFFLFRHVLKSFLFFSHFRKYLGCDYIMDLGLGDSFSDIYGKKRFDSMNHQHQTAHLFKKKMLFLPQTIGPFKEDAIQKEAVQSLENAKMVFARDEQSYNFVKDHTTQQANYQLIDIAFFMPFEVQQFAHDQINVGINVSALLWNGGYTKNNQFNLKSDYSHLIVKVIDHFLALPDVKIHLVPHVVLKKASVENDYEVSIALEKQFKSDRIVVAPFFEDPIEAKNYISGLDFFIGARMHSCIAAFSSGVPVYPMAYSRKFNGLFAQTLDYSYMGDMVHQSEKKIVQGVSHAYDNRKQLKELISERMNGIVREKQDLLTSLMKEFLGLE